MAWLWHLHSRFMENKQVQDLLNLKLLESFIAEAMGLPMTGEKWYTKKTMRIGDFFAFLKPQFTMVDWRCIIPSSQLKEDWLSILRVVQRFITCEGRFSISHLYQMRLLSHISGDDPLNLVHFLYNSLVKMSRKFRKKSSPSPQYIYHQDLIKILVQHQLNKKKKTWDEFLVSEGFQGVTSRKKMGHPKSKRRVNSQNEELEKDVSSQDNSENGLEKLGLERKSSYSSRLT